MSSIFTTRFEYLGHIAQPGPLAVSGRTMKAIKGLETPTDVPDLHSSLLGFYNVY